jgi:hypothetical protein
MKRKKSTGKTTGALVPQKHGGALRNGGTNRGGPGRPPDEFKRICAELASREETIAAVEVILSNPNHPAYLGALKWATEHGYGRPEQTVKHDGEVTHRHGVVILPALHND